MTDPRPQYVIGLEHRRLLWFLLVFTVIAGLWFGVVLYGEAEGFGDDPGRWAFLPTFLWALIGLVFVIGLISYSLALLTIRERPGQLYRLEDDQPAPTTEATPAAPSFLQPQEGETPPPTGEPAPETPQPPEQG